MNYDYMKLVTAEDIDIKKLPEETQQIIADLEKLRKKKIPNTEKRQKELNELINAQIIDWLAEEDDKVIQQAKEKEESQKKEKLDGRMEQCKKIGLIEADGKLSLYSIVIDVTEMESMTDESFEKFIADSDEILKEEAQKETDNAAEAKKKEDQAIATKEAQEKKQQELADKKKKAKEKADSFGIW